jgi:hypothetical protein
MSLNANLLPSPQNSKFPLGLRLLHDVCQKDKQAISDFRSFTASPEAVKYRDNYRNTGIAKQGGKQVGKADSYHKI